MNIDNIRKFIKLIDSIQLDDHKITIDYLKSPEFAPILYNLFYDSDSITNEFKDPLWVAFVDQHAFIEFQDDTENLKNKIFSIFSENSQAYEMMQILVKYFLDGEYNFHITL